MNAIVIMICSFFILLGFEIRHRLTVESMTELKVRINELESETQQLKAAVSLKQDKYEEQRPLA